MAYTIRQYETGALIDSGQTKQQVVAALRAHGLLAYNGPSPVMPRFLRATLIVRPAGDQRGTTAIWNVQT